MNKTRIVQVYAWGSSVITSVLAIIVWGQFINWQIDKLSLYKLFPLLGLIAFSLMWMHYMVGAFRRLMQVPFEALKHFFQITGYLVLVMILLHPGLLIFQLWQDGLGLPPGSYLNNYVASTAAWAALLGTVSLGVFLAYELKRVYGTRTWWKYIDVAQVVALLAVFIHAIQLGGELQSGWYRYVWLFYGISLVVGVSYIYKVERKEAK